MSELAYKHQSQLERIKKNISDWREYWKDNIDRYLDFTRFVFLSTLTETEVLLLKNLQRPVLEFSLLEAYISRLRGEFSNQEPAIEVSSKSGNTVNPEVIRFVEMHMRQLLDNANKDGFEYQVYSDLLGGGFSAAKVFVEYSGEMEFEQEIKVKRVFDPTMTFFDMTAMDKDKGDGEFCGELYIMSADEFQKRYPNEDVSQIKFTKDMTSLGGFNWSYSTQTNKKIIILADYYEKKKLRKKIVMLADGQKMFYEDYKKFLLDWEMAGHIAQPPALVAQRMTEVTKVCRYTLIENKVLSYEETDYKRLPIIFIDGNSVMTRSTPTNAVRQETRPYVYHAKGAQKLKNFIGIMIANDAENAIQHKFMIPKDGIPAGQTYQAAYENVQAASVMVYNQYKDDDPNVPLNPPTAINRQPLDGNMIQMFTAIDMLIQNILGSFDANLAKMSDQQKSGVAMRESITLSNAASKPYIEGFMQGLESIANCVVDLIPLHYTSPVSMPVQDSQGNKSYVLINQDGGLKIDFKQDALQVRVTAGVSFGIQKSQALQQIIALTNASPMFAQFINERGLPYVLDNVECRGIDEIKQEAYIWMEEMQKMKQQMAGKPTPEMMAMQVADKQVTLEAQMMHEKNMIAQQSAEVEAIAKMAEIENEKEKIHMDYVKILADMQMAAEKSNMERDKMLQKTIQDSMKAALDTSRHREEKADKDFEKQFKMIEHAAEMAEKEAIKVENQRKSVD